MVISHTQIPLYSEYYCSISRIYYLLTALNNRRIITYKVSLALLVSIQLIYFLFAFDYSYVLDADFKLIPMLSYLQIMIVGGIIRQKHESLKRFRLAYIFVTVLSFLLYVYQVFRPFQGPLEIVQLYAGLLFSCGLACLVISFEDRIPTVGIVSTVGNLTLEIYLVQFMLIDAFQYFAFPLDIVLCAISIIATAYCVNFLAEKVKMAFPVMK